LTYRAGGSKSFRIPNLTGHIYRRFRRFANLSCPRANPAFFPGDGGFPRRSPSFLNRLAAFLDVLGTALNGSAPLPNDSAPFPDVLGTALNGSVTSPDRLGTTLNSLGTTLNRLGTALDCLGTALNGLGILPFTRQFLPNELKTNNLRS
jgi:hypothetical protein